MAAAFCTNCSAGTYSEARAAICSICDAGKYSLHGATLCTNCSACTYSAAAAEICSICDAGKYSRDGAAICSICSAGKFSALTVVGKFSPVLQIGASVCTDCGAGAYSEAGAAICSICDAGKFSQAAASVCTDCGAGTYSAPGAVSELQHLRRRPVLGVRRFSVQPLCRWIPRPRRRAMHSVCKRHVAHCRHHGVCRLLCQRDNSARGVDVRKRMCVQTGLWAAVRLAL